MARLGRAVFAETYRDAMPPPVLAAYLETAFAPAAVAAGLQSSQGGLNLGAWQAGALTGYASLIPAPLPVGPPGGRAVELSKLYVSSTHHGRGAGEALLQAALAGASERGFEIMWLYVWQRNARAVAFYRKWGFAQAGEQDLDFAGVSFHDLILWRPIEAGRDSTLTRQA